MIICVCPCLPREIFCYFTGVGLWLIHSMNHPNRQGVIFSRPDLPIARRKLGGNIVSWPIQGDQLTYGLIACRIEFVKTEGISIIRLA